MGLLQTSIAQCDSDDAVAVAIRSAPLCVEEAVGGANTVAALSQRVLDARYDVSALPVADQLRLDYKEAEAGGVKLGFSALFVSFPHLVDLVGGGEALERHLASFANVRGVDVLAAATNVDSGNGFKSLILYSAKDGRGAAASPLVQAQLQATPASLPESFLAQPLFVSQDIVSLGFGVVFKPLHGAPSDTVCSTMRAVLTRKTLLPSMLHFLGKGAPLERERSRS